MLALTSALSLTQAPCSNAKDHYRLECCSNPTASVFNVFGLDNIEPTAHLAQYSGKAPEPFRDAAHPFRSKMAYDSYLMAYHEVPPRQWFDEQVKNEAFPQQVINNLLTDLPALEAKRGFDLSRNLEGKVYACVGCSSGVAFQTAILLAQRGAVVHACARTASVFDATKASALKSAYMDPMPWPGYEGQVGVDASVFDRIHFRECDVRIGSKAWAQSARFGIDPNRSMEAFYDSIGATGSGRLDGVISSNPSMLTLADDSRIEVPEPLDLEVASSPNKFEHYAGVHDNGTFVARESYKDRFPTPANIVYHGTENTIHYAQALMANTPDSEKVFAFVASAWHHFRNLPRLGGTPNLEYVEYKDWIARVVVGRLVMDGYNAMAISPPLISSSFNDHIMQSAWFSPSYVGLRSFCPKAVTRPFEYSVHWDGAKYASWHPGGYGLMTLPFYPYLADPDVPVPEKLSSAIQSLADPTDPTQFASLMCIADEAHTQDKLGAFPIHEVTRLAVRIIAADSSGSYSPTTHEVALTMLNMMLHPEQNRGVDKTYYYPLPKEDPMFGPNALSLFTSPMNYTSYADIVAGGADAKRAYKRVLLAHNGMTDLNTYSSSDLPAYKVEIV